MATVDLEVFNKNLLLTQQFCELQLKNAEKSEAEILRSTNLEYNGKKIFDFCTQKYNGKDISIVQWNVDPSGDNNIIPDLFEQAAIKKQGDNGSRINYTGKVLACDLQTVTDGVSEAESKGFIDVYDLPPIDTWVYVLNTTVKATNGRSQTLFSWIPGRFVSLVEEAIRVNMLELLYWIDSPEALHNFNR